MTAAILVHTFQTRGIGFQVDGDRLIVSPSSALTDEDRQIIRDHKSELLALLANQAEPHIAREPCPKCGGAVVVELGEHWKHIYCPVRGHFDRWEAVPGKTIRDAPLGPLARKQAPPRL
ncbi:MAG: hypothetical protein L0Z53_04635 [Acidobacteriales bacterium]|nr:hypothetical protein [Terriglobales bacterium]